MADNKMMLLSIFVSLLFIAPVALSQLSSRYQFNVTLVQDNYWLYWNFNTTTQLISFAVRVQTTGWIGFGLSPNGQMPGSDVVIGWIADNGSNYFHDRFAFERAEPPIDPIQNWFLTSAEVDNGYTTLEFKRDFTTCDDLDLDILFQTAHVIFSWNDQKPTVNGPESFDIQRHTTKGSTVVNLLGGLPNPPNIPEDAQTFTVATNDVTIPSDDTTYWCKADRLPADVRDNVKYIVKFSPHITPGNEEFVHHMLVYICNGLEEEDLGQGGSCFTGGVSDRVAACTGQLLIAAWAIGGSDFIYPSNIAYPVGGPTGDEFIVIETHYNNPNLVSGVQDSSGMTFTYIDTPREHNAGILFMGHEVSHFMVIPPKAENFTIMSVCPGSCSDRNFPSDGIHIFANMLHTHLAGIGLSVRQSRPMECSNEDRFKETKTVDRNLNYDFNFQQSIHLPESVTVMPGDTLTLECYYKTMDRTGVTLGGESTQQEMCLTFLVYYPKLDYEFCVSTPTFNRFDEFIERFVPEEHQPAFKSITPSSSRSTIQTTFDLLEWTTDQVNGFEILIYRDGNQTSYCAPNEPGYNDITPSICCPYEEADNCTGFVPSPCCDKTCPLRDRGLATGASTVYISVTLVLAAVMMAMNFNTE